MSYIEWKSSFSVGDKELDRQHHKIIDLINELGEIIDSGEYDDKDLTRLVHDISKYSFEHLAYEEEFLAAHKYSEFELIKHVLEHNRYREEAVNFQADILDNAADPKPMFVFLNAWWHKHILVEDIKYARSLKMVR